MLRITSLPVAAPRPDAAGQGVTSSASLGQGARSRPLQHASCAVRPPLHLSLPPAAGAAEHRTPYCVRARLELGSPRILGQAIATCTAALVRRRWRFGCAADLDAHDDRRPRQVRRHQHERAIVLSAREPVRRIVPVPTANRFYRPGSHWCGSSLTIRLLDRPARAGSVTCRRRRVRPGGPPQQERRTEKADYIPRTTGKIAGTQ